MFQRKSKPEQVRESAESAVDKASASVGEAAGSILTAVRDAFDGPAAETASVRAAEARERGADLAKHARERAAHARDRAVSNLDHQIDASVPKGQEAIAGVAPKVDHARDVIVDDILPKLSELLGNVQTSKNEVLARQNGPVAAITGAPKKKKRKGGALLAFGVAAGLGAAVAYYLNSQKKPASDPWATEHHVGGAPGVDSQVRASLARQNADKSTATSGAAAGTVGTAGSVGGTAGTAGSVGGTAGATGAASTAGSDTPLGDRLAAQSGDAVGTDVAGGAGSTRMLDGDDIDQLAAGAPVSGDEEIPGTSGSGTSGFGTDFGAADKTTDAVEDHTDSTDRKTDLP